MSSYTALDAAESPTRRSFASLRRPSMSSLRFGSHRPNRVPDPDEMDAAFDAPDDEGETHGLLSGRQNSQPIPGDYDFERDYVSHPISLCCNHRDISLHVGSYRLSSHLRASQLCQTWLIYRLSHLLRRLHSNLTRRITRRRATPMVSCHRPPYTGPIPQRDIF